MSENNPLTQGSRVWVFNVPSKNPSPSHASDPDVAPLSQSEVAAEIPSGPMGEPLRTVPPPLTYIHDPYFPPSGEVPVPAPKEPLCTVPGGTSLPDNPTELVKHQFLIYESDLVDVVADEINFPSQAITRLIRSKLATVCSDVDRYYWRAYASKLDSSVISITAYGTPK